MNKVIKFLLSGTGILVLLLIFIDIGVCKELPHPCFSFQYPDSWVADIKNPAEASIRNPGVKGNSLGVRVAYERRLVENGVNEFMKKAGDVHILRQLAKANQGLELIDAKLTDHGSVPILKAFYRYNYQDQGASGELIQWMIPARGCYLVTFFYLIPEGENVPQTDDILTSVFESFQFSKHRERFAEGIGSFYSRDFERAQELFEAAIQGFEHDSWYWYYRGLSIQAVHGFKKIRESSHSFAKAASLDNQNVDAMVELAGCFMAAGKREKAMEIIEDAIKQRPDSQDLMMKKAYILVKMNHIPQAKAVVQKVLSLNDNHQEAMLLLKRLEGE